MRLYFLIFSIFLFSACSTTPEITSSTENSTALKIQTNQYRATKAQNEYKMLQMAREKEYS